MHARSVYYVNSFENVMAVGLLPETGGVLSSIGTGISPKVNTTHVVLFLKITPCHRVTHALCGITILF